MLRFQGAIFDLDGTVLDSLGMWADIDREFLKKRGLDLPPDYQHAVKTMNFSEAANYTVKRFSLNETPDALMAEWLDMTREYYAHEVKLKPFVKEYLQTLRAEKIPLGVATSSKPELFLPALERCGVREYFSVFVTTDDVNRGKLFPDIYFETAKRLGVNEKGCVVFEDVLTAAKCAHEAGFYTVAVYDEYSAHEEEALRKNSDRFIFSFAELL